MRAGPALRYQRRRLMDESAPKPLLESEVDMVSILFFFVSPAFHLPTSQKRTSLRLSL